MKLIECPRDAWQGHPQFIPTEKKAAYLNQLLRVGFDTIDFGSFVSPKAMPQVQDTSLLINQLDLSQTTTKLLAIVGNERGAREACQFKDIFYLGYPFSISETFQLRNTRATIQESFQTVIVIADLCRKYGKELVIYISMGFGNPYGDAWNSEIVLEWIEKIAQLGIRTFSLADTVGVATEADITSLFTQLIASRKDLEFGAHFHTTPGSWRSRLEAAYKAGCRRFDGTVSGYGGCPMAQNELVGNMSMENLIAYARKNLEPTHLNLSALEIAKPMFLELVAD